MFPALVYAGDAQFMHRAQGEKNGLSADIVESHCNHTGTWAEALKVRSFASEDIRIWCFALVRDDGLPARQALRLGRAGAGMGGAGGQGKRGILKC